MMFEELLLLLTPDLKKTNQFRDPMDPDQRLAGFIFIDRLGDKYTCAGLAACFYFPISLWFKVNLYILDF